jgi:uncharacterized membrane protein
VTAWNPEWRVKINGSTLTNVTLANLSITSGRTSIYEQPTASYANINLINLDQSTINIEINDPVTIEIKNSLGNFIYLYGGFVSEFSKTINRVGSVGYTQTFSILALGALARLPRQLTEGVLTKDQIYSILSVTLFNSWAEVAPTLTWAGYEPTTTWADAENAGLGEIDQPGNYELIARSADTIDVYSLVTQLAASGLGYIYENAQGQICYADSTHRGESLAANGYVDLDAQQAIAPGIRTSTRGQDVRNQITITYKNGQQVSDSDSGSIALYGLLAQNFETTLDLQADAESQAAFYLSLRAYPQQILESITFELGSPDVDNTDRDALLAVSMGTAINLVNLPINMGSNFQGFVEGWTFQARFNTLSVTLLLSPVAYSLEAFRWNNVPVGETWNTLSPTLTWLEATIVA